CPACRSRDGKNSRVLLLQDHKYHHHQNPLFLQKHFASKQTMPREPSEKRKQTNLFLKNNFYSWIPRIYKMPFTAKCQDAGSWKISTIDRTALRFLTKLKLSLRLRI